MIDADGSSLFLISRWASSCTGCSGLGTSRPQLVQILCTTQFRSFMAEDFFPCLKVTEGLDLWRVPVCPQNVREGQCQKDEDPSPAESVSSAAPGSHHQALFLCPWRMSVAGDGHATALPPCLIKALFWCIQSFNDSPPGFAGWVGSSPPVQFSSQTHFLVI